MGDWELRKEPRHATSVPATVVSGNPPRVLSARIVDWSTSAFRVQMPAWTEPGSTLTIETPSKDLEGKFLRFTGTVIASRSDGVVARFDSKEQVNELRISGL